MNHGSLFSGIGGFDLAAQWVGFKNIFQVEIDEHCQKILKKNFPNAKRYRDIKDFWGALYRGSIDIISGGFPCQPFSVAGKQKGAEDDRNLWPEMFRVIQEIQPRWIVGENVAAITSFVEFDNLLADLEGEGFEIQTFIIPACGVDARHRRNRLWIVAYSECNGCTTTEKSWGPAKAIREKQAGKNYPLNTSRTGCLSKTDRIMAYSAEQRLQNGRGPSMANTGKEKQKFKRCNSIPERLQNASNADCERQQEQWSNFTEIFSPKRDSWWEIEPRVGRVVDGVPNRVDRIKGLGNAVVPQIPFRIFEAIKEIESL